MTEEKTLKNEGFKVYEVGYLLLPSVEETKVQEETAKIRDIIENNKGQFLSEGTPELKTLTYPMTKLISGKKQKFANAYFSWIKFEGGSETAKSVKDEIEKFDNILRFILVTTVRENIIMPTKSGKFSFDKKEKKEKLEEKKNIKENKEKEEKIDKKELDETIDDLVIE